MRELHPAKVIAALAIVALACAGPLVAAQGNKSDAPRTPHVIEPLVIGGGWQDFGWGETGEVFAGETFTFTSIGLIRISVTDGFCAGDIFKVYDNGAPIGTTSTVPNEEDCLPWNADPNVTFLSPDFSHGVFYVGGGNHSITIEVIQDPFGNGEAFIRADVASITEIPTLDWRGLAVLGVALASAALYLARRRRTA